MTPAVQKRAHLKRQADENTSSFGVTPASPAPSNRAREDGKPFGAKAEKCAKFSGEGCTNW
jgi:hypothetical protein